VLKRSAVATMPSRRSGGWPGWERLKLHQWKAARESRTWFCVRKSSRLGTECGQVFDCGKVR